jgi:hypothetical protein
MPKAAFKRGVSTLQTSSDGGKAARKKRIEWGQVRARATLIL